MQPALVRLDVEPPGRTRDTENRNRLPTRLPVITSFITRYLGEME